MASPAPADQLRRSALRYAEEGWGVIPLHTPIDGTCDCRKGATCESPGKHPWTRNGLKDATTDLARLDAWWRQWPLANIGLVLPRDLVAIDVDSPDALDGFDEHPDWDLPETWNVTTGKGWHYIYRTDQPVKGTVGIMPGVDLRGYGNYLVAPPSLHANGLRYKQNTSMRDIALAPAWIAARQAQVDPTTADAPGDLIPEGKRNETLTSFAGTMRRRGFSEDEILAALRIANANRCRPPLPDEDVETIARSVSRYAPEPEPMKLITGGKKAEVPADGLHYMNPAEIASLTPAKTDWIIRGFLARQAITEIDGKIKAAGKTTFILDMVRCVLEGHDFLGQPTQTARVVYLTEQQPGPFRTALERAFLLAHGPELRVLFRRDIEVLWPALIKRVAEDALSEGYSVLIVDTLGKLSGIRDENDASLAGAAMSPLQNAAHDGLAVIVARHDRKGGGEVGESGRGSSQTSGDVDIILGLRRPEGNVAKTRRVIESLSRYEETPEKVIVDLSPHGYVLLGEGEAVQRDDAIRFICSLLTSELGTNQSVPRQSIISQAKEQGISGKSIGDGLNVLLGEGSITKMPIPGRGNPVAYYPVASSFRFVPNSSPIEGTNNQIGLSTILGGAA